MAATRSPVAADEEVSALIAVVLPTAATGDLVAAIRQADVRLPMAAVVLDQAESVRLLPGPDGRGSIPAYGYPEAAVAAVSRAAGYGKWRAESRGTLPEIPDIRTADARAVIAEFLRREPGGGWLPPGQVSRLLRCYGMPLMSTHDDSVPPMITGGTEVIAGITNDGVFGPLVVFGLGGVATETGTGASARLTPLTDTDANALIRAVMSAPLPLGRRDTPSADLGALRDVLLRLARLADDLPEVSDVDLSPVIARSDGTFVIDARVKAARRAARDPFLRDLCSPGRTPGAGGGRYTGAGPVAGTQTGGRRRSSSAGSPSLLGIAP
jgi:acyl-CoA synthetase (NDP forming)